MKNYGMAPSEKDINGVFFAVFSPMASTSTSKGTSSAIMDIVDKLVPFEGVDIGPIIGKGSFGSVFKAAYQNKIVAIKVSQRLNIPLQHSTPHLKLPDLMNGIGSLCA